VRFTTAKFGIAVLAAACLAAGMSSAASGATHAGTGAAPCASACPSLTRLSITNPGATFGSEDSVVFNVRVRPRMLHMGATPTGTVTLQYQATVLCTVVLSGGAGSCSPSPTALPARNKGYPVNAVYGGDATFTASHSGARHLRVTT
jgi:hypothetical protein